MNSLGTDDRRVLEGVIFPAVARDPGVRRALFVGCHESSSWYPGLFRFALRFDTVDPDPAAAVHGASKRHRVGTLESLGRDPHLHGIYDVIFVNGVFGYGIDSNEEQEEAIDVIHVLLRPGGAVIVGYRDRVPGPDVDIGAFDSGRFVPSPIPGLSVSYHKTAHENHHAFACLRKR